MEFPHGIEQYQDNIARLWAYPWDRDSNKNKIQTPSITFQVTDACNLRCTYCYQINKSEHVMPIEVAKKFIDMLLDNDEHTKEYLDSWSSDAIILDFIGGEPLLQPDLIDEILEYFREQTILKNHPWQYNWRASISSNGTLYFESAVQRFINKWFDHLSLGISIDGNKELHDACRLFPNGEGSYDKAIAAAHHYRDVLGGYVGSKMTLAPANIAYTYDAIMGFIDEGYTDINLNCVFEKGWTEKHATILYEQLKKIADYLIANDLEEKIYLSIFDHQGFHPKDKNDITNWCGGNGAMIAVDWKGDIYPCLRYMESSLGNEVAPIKIGDIYNGMMTDAKCKNCIERLRAVNRLTQSTDECINCSIAEGCAWCQAYNYQSSGGDFNHRATYICIMHKARALANAYFWNLCAWKHNETWRFKIWLPDEEALKIISQEELDELKILQYPLE